MRRNSERGAVVVESTWCILLVLFVCLFFISYGFVLYQRTVVTVMANDIAEDIAITYKLKNVADASSVTAADVYSVGKYRYLFFSGDFETANNAKGTALGQKRARAGEMAQAVGNTTVKVEKIKDDIGRYHLKVTVKQRYHFFLGDLLSVIGQADTQMVEASVNVVGTDMLSYSNTLHTVSYMTDAIGELEVVKIVNNVISLLGTIFNIGC